MANKALFGSARGPATDTTNAEGSRAYSFSPEHELAQYAVTGCFNATFYATAEEQVDRILEVATRCSPEFVAKAAIYGRKSGFMKDAPALLLAHLFVRDPSVAMRAFAEVIDNGKMLRNLVQILRSGRLGRRSIPRPARVCIREWFNVRTPENLFRQSIGNDPSLADVVKMVHPRPNNQEKAALYRYLLGKAKLGDDVLLPPVVMNFEVWKRNPEGAPAVPFLMLSGVPNLSPSGWRALAWRASWHETRMNLNTFARHGVFEDRELVRHLAARLRDPEAIRKAKAFPYQLMTTYLNVENLPHELWEALRDAMETATENVPDDLGKVLVFVDTSGSMRSAVTGIRKGSTTTVRCVEVAGLIAASILRRNPTARVVPFNDKAYDLRLNPRDSVTTIAERIFSGPDGGTNLSCALDAAIHDGLEADLVLYVSDNESWIDGGAPGSGARDGSRTATLRLWEVFKAKNPRAKMACLDLTPNATTQAKERSDILNIGGFSDAVWPILRQFALGDGKTDTFVDTIRKVSL